MQDNLEKKENGMKMTMRERLGSRKLQGVLGFLLIAGGLLGVLSLGTAGGALVDNALAVESTTPDSYVDGVRGMIEEHMGAEFAGDEGLAESMAAHMQEIHGEDAQEMLEFCGGADGESFMSGGMMGEGSGIMGTGSGGMMGF